MLLKVCSTVIHPLEYDFPSKTEPGVVHTVISSSILNDAFCTCPGWHFNLGKCSHVDMVEENHCDWVGGPAEEFANTTECPKCGAPVEDFETRSEFVF